jgi:hypothetical protein
MDGGLVCGLGGFSKDGQVVGNALDDEAVDQLLFFDANGAFLPLSMVCVASAACRTVRRTVLFECGKYVFGNFPRLPFAQGLTAEGGHPGTRSAHDVHDVLYGTYAVRP